LEGVPFRLSAKFHPQPRPQFKEVDIHIPLDALQDDYDFSLERGVMVEVRNFEEKMRLEAERRAEEEKLRQDQEEEVRRKPEEERLPEDESLLKEELDRNKADEEVIRLLKAYMK